jgi:hypothetical protein
MNVILTDQNILDRLWCESKGGIPWMPRSLAVISCFDLEMVVTESKKMVSSPRERRSPG